MAKNVTKYSIFLASPGDLSEERLEVESVVNELNLTYGHLNNLMFELIKWETHSAPGISDTYTQDLISKDLGDDYDLFIGIIWQRFGTKTKLADSGTEEEFLNALLRFQKRQNIQILFYFKNTPPKALDQIDIEELSKIQNFKNKLKAENVLFWTFNDIDELKTSLRLHIPKRVEMLRANLSFREVSEQEKGHKHNLISLGQEDMPEEEDFGLFDYAVSFESLLSDATGALGNITASTVEMREDLTKRTEEINRIAQQPNPSKIQMAEVLKRVSKTMNNYIERLKIETPIFYENFKDAIDIGLKYMNLMADLDESKYFENLQITLNESRELRDSLPESIAGVRSMHNAVISMPRLQADLNLSKRKLVVAMQDLIDKMESAHKLTGEFVDEMELRLQGQ